MHKYRIIPKYKANTNSHKGKINTSTIIFVDINTPLPSMDRLSRDKINKEILALNDILDQKN